MIIVTLAMYLGSSRHSLPFAINIMAAIILWHSVLLVSAMSFSWGAGTVGRVGVLSIEIGGGWVVTTDLLSKTGDT